MIPTDQFIEAVLKYKDSPHTNPTSPVTGSCEYFSTRSSPTGTVRCLIGQVLFDLKVVGEQELAHRFIDAGSLIRDHYPDTFEDALEVGRMAGDLQRAADNIDTDIGRSNPIPWSVAIHRVLGDTEEYFRA